jgi:PAT family beta-lactamase induction signal transducer AmpG
MSQPTSSLDADNPAIEARKPSWHDSLAALWERRVLIMVLLGFSAGLPILLIFSSLSLWLVEAGVERKAVTFFSWAALGYSFKFVWAPLVDRMALPVLTGLLGQRRSWLLLAQAGVIAAMVGMASVDPAGSPDQLSLMAAFAVLLGFSSASQDIVIDAYRIELAPPEMQALLSSAYIAGYRVGMIVAGAGALYLASYWGSTKELYVYAAWQKAYWVMAGAMGVGVLTALLMPEQRRPATAQAALRGNLRLFLVFLGAVSAFVLAFFHAGPIAVALLDALGGGPMATLLVEALRLSSALAGAAGAGWVLVRLGLADTAVARDTWVVPVRDFFDRYGASTAWLVLALVGLYRISDIVLGVISNVFYADMGYSKIEIANAVKTFGVLISIGGGFMGGILATRYGVMRCLMWGAVMAALTNLIFVALAKVGYSLPMLYLVVSADNLAAGFASAAFVAFLSSLVNVSFTATQYALFSSLMTLLPKSLGGYSGGIVDAIGYPGFFVATTLMGLPVIVLVWLAARRLELRDPVKR